MRKFRKIIEEKSEKYSDRFIDGTRRAMALMSTLGFKRNEYRARCEREKGKGNGWEMVTIHINDKEYHPGKENPLLKKVIDNADLILEAEFNIYFHVNPDKPHLNFIIIDETDLDYASLEISVYNAKTKDTIMTEIKRVPIDY